MWIFQRSPKRDRRDAPRDAEYGFFSVDEAAYFRAHVREAFAEHGLEVNVHNSTVSDSAGRRFGLGNIAAICHHDARGRRWWPGAIRAHVGRVLRTVDGPSPLQSLASEELLARLRPWVVTQDIIEPDAVRYTHARIIAPGVCEVLALELDESVMTLTDDSLAPLGNVVDLRVRALDNLRALPVETHAILRGPRDTRFEVVTGDSLFTASRILTADEVAWDLTRRGLGSDGALVAIPNSYQLALRPIGTARDSTLIPTLFDMTAFAAANFKDAVAQISPDVYWWRRGTLTRLVRHDGRLPEFTDNSEFEMLLRRLAGGGGE